MRPVTGPAPVAKVKMYLEECAKANSINVFQYSAWYFLDETKHSVTSPF